MSEQKESNELVELKAEMYDLHKSYQQQLQQQSQILSTIVNKLGFDGEVSIDDVLGKIAELMPEEDADPLP